MQKTTELALTALGGRSACIVMQLDKSAPRELVSINSDMLFPAASLAKLPNFVAQGYSFYAYLCLLEHAYRNALLINYKGSIPRG